MDKARYALFAVDIALGAFNIALGHPVNVVVGLLAMLVGGFLIWTRPRKVRG